jgi:hypothetical protein
MSTENAPLPPQNKSIADLPPQANLETTSFPFQVVSSPRLSSPKRKYDDFASPIEVSFKCKPSPQRLDTQIPSYTATKPQDEGDAQGDGTASPRAKVAHDLDSLSIQGSTQGKEDNIRSNPKIQRKLNFKPMNTNVKVMEDAVMADDDSEDKARKARKKAKLATRRVVEVPETPQQPTLPRLQPDPQYFKSLQFAASVEPQTENLFKFPKTSGSPNSKRLKSPPLSSSPSSLSSTPDSKALTWQPHELISYDPHDPDDDGEGLDGIGYRPTSAQQQKRDVKRRKQLEEYRSRENREERRRRSERRGIKHGLEKKLEGIERQRPNRRVKFLEIGEESAEED